MDFFVLFLRDFQVGAQLSDSSLTVTMSTKLFLLVLSIREQWVVLVVSTVKTIMQICFTCVSACRSSAVVALQNAEERLSSLSLFEEFLR